MRPRLSSVATSELVLVQRIIQDTSLSELEDSRIMAWGDDRRFSSRAVYKVTAPGGILDGSAMTCWSTRLPSKLKIFCFLAGCDRLSTRANLHFKGCASSPLCVSCGANETSRHILFDCSVATDAWSGCAVTPLPSCFGTLSAPSLPRLLRDA